jgi:predicted  nucleic acid-binding Zn-ribbon protein
MSRGRKIMDDVIYSLQETDQKKDSLAREIKEKKACLAAIAAQIEDSRSQLESAKTDNVRFTVELNKVEANLDSCNSKKKHADLNLLNVTSEKQLEALNSQIEKLVLLIEEHEATILSMYEEQESAEKKISDMSSALKALEVSSRNEVLEIESSIKKIAVEREELVCRRLEMLTTMDPELAEKYERLYVRHGGQVLFDTEDMVCPGCGLALPRRLFNKMESHRDEFYDCNSCGRILRYVGV